MKSLKMFIPLILISFLLGGCYTQLLMHPSGYERQKKEAKTQEEQYYEEYQDTSESYGEDYYYEDGYTEPNTYYYSPYYPYSRYFWGYYPGISIGFYWDWGYSYYYPYYWAPIYYPWCGSYYYPYYCSYYSYPGYCYGYGYYYPSPHGYWSNANIYRTRTKSGYKLRNNDGLRSSYVSRNRITGRNNDIVTKTSSIDDVIIKSPARVISSNSNVRKSNVKKSNVYVKESKIGTSRNSSINKIKIEKKSSTTPMIIKRYNAERKSKSGREYKPITKTEQKSKVKQVRKSNTPKRYSTPKRSSSSPKSYSPPKRSSSPPKSYSPPKRNSSPPKSYSTPRNSTPRSSGSHGGGSRGASRNSGGKRTR